MMKKSMSLLFAVIALPILMSAQERRHDNHNHGGPRDGYYQEMQGEPGSALSIFSENGERFFLMLNGIKQNSVPQSRIRIEDLPKVVNDIQIIFDDNRTPAISKTVTFMDPVEGHAVNLVMKLVRDRSGYARLAFHRLNTLEREYRGEQGEYIMHYGRDNAPVQVNVPPPPPPPPAGPMPMDSKTFSDAKRAIAGTAWDDTRLSTAKTILNSNYVTTQQVIEICRIFSWDENKLEFAKYAFKKTVDNNNYFKVNAVFSWDDSKTALNNYVNENR